MGADTALDALSVHATRDNTMGAQSAFVVIDRKRFVMSADEKLTAFVKLESAIMRQTWALEP
ncbi:MAG TPA: hypothetical protein VGK01_20060 [Candidatus Angelobacter sp.]